MEHGKEERTKKKIGKLLWTIFTIHSNLVRFEGGGGEWAVEGVELMFNSSSRAEDGSTCSSSSSFRRNSGRFSQDWPLHILHKVEHFRPAFLQPQAPMHPVAHLQDTVFKSFRGAASLSVVIGSKPRLPLFQPHSSGSFFSPSHVITWWYARKAWNLAASGVGGSFARLSLVLLEINLLYLREVRDWTKSPPYKATKIISPASEICVAVASGSRNFSAWWSNNVLFWNKRQNLFFPKPKMLEVVSQPLIAWRSRTFSCELYLNDDEQYITSGELPLPGFRKYTFLTVAAVPVSITSKSISSPIITTASYFEAIDLAVVTINTSASSSAWSVLMLAASSSEMRSAMKRFLFLSFDNSFSWGVRLIIHQPKFVIVHLFW